MAFLRHPLVIGVLFITILLLATGWYLDDEPDFQQLSPASSVSELPVVGSATTDMLIKTAETLLEKRGGYMSNDVMPPMVLRGPLRSNFLKPFDGPSHAHRPCTPRSHGRGGERVRVVFP